MQEPISDTDKYGAASRRLVQICTRRNIMWDDEGPELHVQNGLLRTTTSLMFCSHSRCPFLFRMRFCTSNDDLLDLIQDPNECSSPWQHKDVLDAFLDAETQRPSSSMKSFDIQMTQRLLSDVEAAFLNISWKRTAAIPESWPRRPDSNWALIYGFAHPYRLLVGVRLTVAKTDLDSRAKFAIFLDVNGRRALLLPADLTDEAVMYAI
jgi:hypothetical protein